MEWRERAALVTPGGTQTRSKANLFPEGPVTIERGQGSQVWDLDGQQYTDWISALAAVSLGYRHPEVDEAVVRQIRDWGVIFPLACSLETEIAEMLLDVLGWPEQVRWVKTGTEATAAAMLVARAATGRRKILSFGYHGWSPAHVPGPELVQLPVDSWAMDAIDEYTAGVMVECLRDSDPTWQATQTKWVKEIYKRCKLVGALVIMDEIVTGFRWAIGGAREFLGLPAPDLACFGKGMANGYPIAALVGPRRLMQHAVNVSSTFGGEAMGLAALEATLAIYARDKVIERLWQTGRLLMTEAETRGVKMHGYPPHPAPQTFPYERAQHAMTQRVLFHPTGHFNVTAAHTEDDVLRTADALVL